ncbi:MAG TPA: alpha-amylase family protein [Acetobacteraceae bacterium]|nr:alpha-amylase family protein [Acetobacteraceae bacterium]
MSLRARKLALAAAFALPALARAAPPPWPGIPIIDYDGGTQARLAALKSLGVTAVKVLGQREGDVQLVARRAAPLRDAGFGCYVENIATDFYAAYHRWSPDHPPNYRFLQLQAEYRADPSSLPPLMRDPSLSDPVWLGRIEDRLAAHARVMRPFHPLWYSLADEPGIADLAAFWDFDFSPASLAAFREWLRGQYGNLNALNAEWGTHYAAWSSVQPWTTRAAIAAPPGNVAPWADFKAFMDVAFARALRAGADALHRADAEARAAIEGAQVPGWGGYDYSLLSHAVDVMEVYDAGQNMSLLQAFNPRVLPVMTAFGGSPAHLYRLWRLVLDGARAVVIWDANPPLITPDDRITARGEAYRPIFAALRGPAGAALSHATPIYDPVAILYSPASFRVQWMIENRPRGDAWMHGGSEADAQGVATRTALDSFAETLKHLGLRPRYLTDTALGAAPPANVRLLVLPHQVALSDAELRSLRAFVAAGGTVLTDSPFGLTDLHGRARAAPPADIRATTLAPDDRAGMVAVLRAAKIAPLVMADADDAEIDLWHADGKLLIAVQRDFAEGASPKAVTLTLPRPMRGEELITGTAIAPARSIRLTLDTVTPALLALTPAAR